VESCETCRELRRRLGLAERILRPVGRPRWEDLGELQRLADEVRLLVDEAKDALDLGEATRAVDALELKERAARRDLVDARRRRNGVGRFTFLEQAYQEARDRTEKARARLQEAKRSARRRNARAYERAFLEAAYDLLGRDGYLRIADEAHVRVRRTPDRPLLEEPDDRRLKVPPCTR